MMSTLGDLPLNQVADTVTCSNCNHDLPVDEAVIDENEGSYFCDEICFRDWASDNMAIVVDYYIGLNVYMN